jgi:hypothetical protein
MRDISNFLDELEESRNNGHGCLYYSTTAKSFYFNDADGHSSYIATSVEEPSFDNLNKIEAFLAGTKENPLGRNRKRYLKEEYALTKGSYKKYTIRGSLAFKTLCAKYDRARFFHSWSDIYYAMLDGRREWESPCGKEVIAKDPDAEILNRVEEFLTDTRWYLTDKRERFLKGEYSLGQNRWGNFTTAGKFAFQILSAKYARTRYFKDWSDLYFAVLENRREWEIPWRAAI